MQKLLRINSNNIKRKIRRLRADALEQREDRKEEWKQQSIRIAKEAHQNVKAERKARREDWIAGPLAPDRNTGLTQGIMGAMSPEMTRPITKPLSVRKKTERPHYGNKYNIILGDRVCVIRGRDQGKIGEISDIDLKNGRCTVQGVNEGDVVIPPTAQPEMRSKRVNSSELPLDLDDVRLVTKRIDPMTGQEKDVIARFVEGGEPYLIRIWGSNLPKHTRYFGGTDEVIPWPEEEIEQFERQKSDTPRALVETKTYLPSILQNPLPDKWAVKEIHNKFQREKEIYENEYIKGKIMEDARSEWYRSRRMITPRQQHAEQLSQREREAELAVSRQVERIREQDAL